MKTTSTAAPGNHPTGTFLSNPRGRFGASLSVGMLALWLVTACSDDEAVPDYGAAETAPVEQPVQSNATDGVETAQQTGAEETVAGGPRIPENLPEEIPVLRQMAGYAYSTGDYSAFRRVMQKLTSLRPMNPEYQYQLVIANALLDDKPAAYDTMLKMQRQGLSFDFNDNEDTTNIRDTELYGFVNNLMMQAGEARGSSEVFATLPDSMRLAEAIAWDGAGERLLVGSVADGRIVQIDGEGEVRDFASPPANQDGWWSIYDLLVDADAGVLWASTAARPPFESLSADSRGRSGLLKFDLDSGELQQRILLPDDGKADALANMTSDGAGGLFVADARRPVIYRLPADGSAIEPFLASPLLDSIRGISYVADTGQLYVVDYARGILRVDVAQRQAAPLMIPESLNLYGTDGLIYDDGALIIIQSGFRPQRVMRLELTEDGTEVTTLAALQVAHEDFDAPTYGVVGGDRLYYFANSHWAAVESGRLPADGLAPVRILQSPLESDVEVFAPTFEDLERALPEESKALPGRRAQPEGASDPAGGPQTTPPATPDSGDAEDDQN